MNEIKDHWSIRPFWPEEGRAHILFTFLSVINSSSNSNSKDSNDSNDNNSIIISISISNNNSNSNSDLAQCQGEGCLGFKVGEL